MYLFPPPASTQSRRGSSGQQAWLFRGTGDGPPAWGDQGLEIPLTKQEGNVPTGPSAHRFRFFLEKRYVVLVTFSPDSTHPAGRREGCYFTVHQHTQGSQFRVKVTFPRDVPPEHCVCGWDQIQTPHPWAQLPTGSTHWSSSGCHLT